MTEFYIKITLALMVAVVAPRRSVQDAPNNPLTKTLTLLTSESYPPGIYQPTSRPSYADTIMHCDYKFNDSTLV